MVAKLPADPAAVRSWMISENGSGAAAGKAAYYAQGYSLAILGKPLLSASVINGSSGPYIPGLNTCQPEPLPWEQVPDCPKPVLRILKAVLKAISREQPHELVLGSKEDARRMGFSEGEIIDKRSLGLFFASNNPLGLKLPH